MSKLKLDVDALRVESFQVTKESPIPRGTVRAHSDIQPLDPEPDPYATAALCGSMLTWQHTCVQTCAGCVAYTGYCYYNISKAC
jgi:hypothetical protein